MDRPLVLVRAVRRSIRICMALRRNAEIVAIGAVTTVPRPDPDRTVPGIAVLAVSMLGVLHQIPLHARFGFLREGATKRSIEALHRAYGVAGERLIVHIVEATVRRRMQAAELHGVLDTRARVTERWFQGQCGGDTHDR